MILAFNEYIVSEMPNLAGQWLWVILTALSIPAQAQYATLGEADNSRHAAQRQALDTAREKYIGRTFWIVPNPEASSYQRVQFQPNLRRGTGPGQSRFVVTEATTFVIDGFEGGLETEYVRVRFPDGKTAYLEEDPRFRNDPVTNPPFDNVREPGAKIDSTTEYILSMSPEDLQIAERKQQAKSARVIAARKARGGARIGMTAAQVRKSEWGTPNKVNRSTGSYGVHEQWVYGGNNYIFLENGIVTSIHN